MRFNLKYTGFSLPLYFGRSDPEYFSGKEMKTFPATIVSYLKAYVKPPRIHHKCKTNFACAYLRAVPQFPLQTLSLPKVLFFLAFIN